MNERLANEMFEAIKDGCFSLWYSDNYYLLSPYELEKVCELFIFHFEKLNNSTEILNEIIDELRNDFLGKE